MTPAISIEKLQVAMVLPVPQWYWSYNCAMSAAVCIYSSKPLACHRKQFLPATSAPCYMGAVLLNNHSLDTGHSGSGQILLFL
jgi:hypothetical protein